MVSMIEFGLNATMVVLLGATVFYCWVLNRRIQVLQDSKSDLASLLRQFDRSTKRAAEAMDNLQSASTEAAKSIQARIEKAQYVVDDLNYMIDRAGKAADQMEAGIAIARQREKLQPKNPPASAPISPLAPTQAQPVAAVRPAVKPAVTFVPRPFTANGVDGGGVPASQNAGGLSLRELMQHNAGDEWPEDHSKDSILQSLRTAKAGGKPASDAMSSLQSLIEKVAERNAPQAAAGAAVGQFDPMKTRPQSRGERELLKALQLQTE